LAEGLRTLGLLGVFLASFVGHLSIVMKDIIFIPVLLYVANFWNPLLLGLMGGLGGGLGELGAYLMGRGIGRFAADKEKTIKLPKWAKKLGLFGVLLFSLTPLPDTPVLMLLGTTHFPILTVLALEILGKTILYTGVAVVGEMFYSSLSGTVSSPWDSILIISVSLGLSFVVTWERTRTRISKLIQNLVNRFRKKNLWKEK